MVSEEDKNCGITISGRLFVLFTIWDSFGFRRYCSLDGGFGGVGGLGKRGRSNTDWANTYSFWRGT
jgi:hypothetical protein